MTIYAMIDIETLGTRPDCAFFQVGLVFFDKEKIIEEYFWNIDYMELLERGFTYSPATMKWWKTQHPNILSTLDNVYKPIHFLNSFSDAFMKHKPKHVFANDPNFDCVIIENLYRQYLFSEFPWKYYDLKSFRTISWIAGLKMKSKNTHNALEDCKNQVDLIQKCLEKLQINS